MTVTGEQLDAPETGDVATRSADVVPRVPMIEVSTHAAARTAANQVVSGLMSLAPLAQKGELLRVVGPERLLKGLKSGAFEYMKSAGGKLGTVVDKKGEIVGQVRLADSSVKAGAAVAGAFQIASVVTGQYYLHTITEQLGSLQESVDRVTQKIDDEYEAELDAGHGTVMDLYSLFVATGSLVDRDWDRLANAETLANNAYFRELRSVTRFAGDVADVASRMATALERSGTGSPPHGLKRLKADLVRLTADVPIADGGLRRLVRSVRLVLEIKLLRAVIEAQQHPERGTALRSEAERAFTTMGNELLQVDNLGALHGFSDGDLSRLFALDKKATRALSGYQQQMTPAAELLRGLPLLLDDLGSANVTALDVVV